MQENDSVTRSKEIFCASSSPRTSAEIVDKSHSLFLQGHSGAPGSNEYYISLGSGVGFDEIPSLSDV